eukprot:4371671-Prymnesium_polylepis.1
MRARVPQAGRERTDVSRLPRPPSKIHTSLTAARPARAFAPIASQTMSDPQPSGSRLLHRASTGLPPPLLTPHTDSEDDTSLDDLDLRKLLLLGSGFYTVLNCLTYPLAVVKTRMQATTSTVSTIGAARDLHRLAGVGGFY